MREKTPVMTTAETPFEIGKAHIMYRPDGLAHVGIIATGALVHKALLAARKLEKNGIRAIVMNIHTIKPLDTAAIIALARETRAIVTVEEHQIAGGLGGAVAETLASSYPAPIEFIGVHDQFGQSGKPEELLNHYGMSMDDIVEAAKKVMERKQ
jgi:transketolase